MNTKKISASKNQTPNLQFQQPETRDKKMAAGGQYRELSIPAETGSPFHSDQHRAARIVSAALHHPHLHSPCRLPPPMRLLQSGFDYGRETEDGHPG